MLLVPFVCMNLTKTYSMNTKEVNLSENKTSIGLFFIFLAFTAKFLGVEAMTTISNLHLINTKLLYVWYTWHILTINTGKRVGRTIYDLHIHERVPRIGWVLLG